MPSKNNYLRYRIIDKQLKGGGVVSLATLRQACELAMGTTYCDRTIEQDIRAMRESLELNYIAPILTIKGEGYYYSDPHYTISDFPLNNDELNIISQTSSILKQFRDVPFFGDFIATSERLVEAIDFYRQQPGALINHIDFEKAHRQEGNEHLQRLLDAIVNQQPIRLTYQKFNQAPPIEYVVSPYLLKEYRNRWYLIGYSHQRVGIRSFGLDRIVNFSHDSTAGFSRMPFSVQGYFRDVIGMSVIAETAIVIRIAFTPGQASYLITQPLHHTQSVDSNPLPDGRQVISFKLIPNFEFYSQVLAWGDSAEVLSPPRVRDEVINRAKALMRRYNPAPTIVVN